MTNRKASIVGFRVALAAFLAVIPVMGTASAGGNSSCTFSGGEVYVNLMQDDSSGILSRDAAGLILYQEEGSTAQPCGVATVLTTDLIKVEDTSSGGSTGIIFDLSEGSFTGGSGDIPVRIDLGSGTLDTFGLIGGSDPDVWTFGSNARGDSRGNLQSDASAEVKFLSEPDFGFGLSNGGADKACSLGSGARGIPGKSFMGWVWIGGADADVICGGLASDRLVGQAGDDRVRGGGGGDIVKGGADADRLKGGSSGDILRGSKGNDSLKGGAGFDRCSGGPGADQEARCER